MNIQLRTRLGALVWGAMLAIAGIFGLLLLARDAAYERELRALLMSSQRLAWERSRTAVEERLAAAVRQVATDAIAPYVASKDKEVIAKQATLAVSGIRMELLDLERTVLFDSAEDAVIRQPLLSVAAAREVANGKIVSGLEHAPAIGFVLFRAQAIRFDGSVVGILVASAPISAVLNDLRDGLGGDMVLATLRGSRVTELGNNLLGSSTLPTTITNDIVESGVGRGQAPIRKTITLLAGWNQRPVAALVNVQDVSSIERENLKFRWFAILIGVSGGVLVACIVALYLRSAFRPLDQATLKLARMSEGDTSPDLDVVLAHDDEIGRITRASEPLRVMVAENQILHEERERVGAVQERMIVDAMGELASTLPPERRDEVFASIYEHTSGGEGDGSESASTLTKLAKTLSNLTAQVTQAVQTREAHARMSRELEIASRLQHSVLPKQALRHVSASTYATMIPAFEVGGDFYDYWLIDETHLALVIADVSGKGVPGALFMAITRTLLRASDAAVLNQSVSRFIERVNDYLSIDNDQAMFVTAWMGVLDLSTGQMHFVNAGHNPPIHKSRDNSRYLDPARNMALGAMDGLTFAQGTLNMVPGDAIVLYTDGVTEATSVQKQLFGEEALLDVVTGLEDVSTLPEQIVAAVRKHENGAPQADDITILTLKYFGSGQSK